MHLPASTDGPAQIIIAQVGIIGLSGANDAGIGVVVNNLWQLQHGTAGLPVAFVIRCVHMQCPPPVLIRVAMSSV